MSTRSLLGRALALPAMAAAAVQVAPRFFERVSADRNRPIQPAPLTPRFVWPEPGLHAAWIGHSTVLLSIDGFTILTDPVFSARIGVNLGPLTLGLKRLVEPAAPLEALPHPDLILLSHAHMDHFDLPSLRRLESPTSTVVTADATADLLRPGRFAAVHELKWDQSIQVGPALVRAFRVKHWGARMRNDSHRGYNGYLIEIGQRRIVFGGDTAYTETFRALRSSRPIDLAIMPIGAYNPWIAVHCNPEQALAMADDAGAEFILPVHHQTFQLSDEPESEPLNRLLAASGRNPDRIRVGQIGGEFHLA